MKTLYTLLSACFLLAPSLWARPSDEFGNDNRDESRTDDQFLGALSLGQKGIVAGARAGIPLAVKVPPAAPKQKDRGDFKVVYVPPKDPAFKKWEKKIRDSRMLEDNAKLLNRQFILPYDVALEVSECGTANAFYSADDRKITLCYEMFADDAQTLSKVVTGVSADDAALSSEYYTLFHELGHALIHLYEIPAVGKEEDAVDQLSALVLLDAGEGGYQALLMAIAMYHQSGLDKKEQLFWDVHSLDHQRKFELLCLMYGKDPKRHADLVPDMLPKERADGCPDDYRRLDDAWDKLLAPHLQPIGPAPSH